MVEYLKNKVIDELKDSVEYMRKALETKGNPCSRIFYQLSIEECGHANELYKLFMLKSKSQKETDERIPKMTDEIFDAYIENTGALAGLKQLYCE